MHRPIICAHACGADLGRDNSTETAKKSLETLQARDCIEADIQETRDGELVLIHGGVMDSIRFALGYPGKVKDVDIGDLKAIQPGINTLDELINVINGTCGMMLDIKDPSIRVGRLKETMTAHTGGIWFTAAYEKILRDAMSEAADWPRIAQCRTATRRQIDNAIHSTNPHTIDIWPMFLSKKKAAYVQSLRREFMAGGMPVPFSRAGENPDRIRDWIKWGTNCIVTYNPGNVRKIMDSACMSFL